MLIIRIFSLTFCVLFFTSCVEKLDFSQIEDYDSPSVVDVSFAYFNVKSNNFIDGSIELDEISSTFDFRVFQYGFVNKNIVKFDLNIEIVNEFDNDFIVQIFFLDENNVVAYKFEDIQLKANDANFKFKESVDVLENSKIKNTVSVEVVFKNADTSNPINVNSTSSLNFKSYMSLHLVPQ